MVRILPAVLVFVLSGSMMIVDAGPRQRAPQDRLIRAAAVPFDTTDPVADRAGALGYLGGWVLSSDDPDFGGISAMALTPDGFVAISDAGGVFRFAIDEDGRISRASITSLPAGPGPENGGEPAKVDRDSEAMFRDPETGRYWVSFEHHNMIWRYDPAFSAAESSNGIAAMEDWPSNGGAEAMVRLADGRILVFSEAGDGPADSREILLFDSDPSEAGGEPLRLGYRPPPGFGITDAAQLPDGRLVVLHRRFTMMEGVSIALSLVPLGSLAENSILEGRVIARLAPPMTVDNMEAIAVAEENGRTILWMASDDNFSPLQRTLLLKFELVEAR